jgi:hypothetical protein
LCGKFEQSCGDRAGIQRAAFAQGPEIQFVGVPQHAREGKNYKNGLLDQSPETYIFAGVMPGGTVGFLALQHRKDEIFRRDIEQACMSKPPDRSYLDKPVGR